MFVFQVRIHCFRLCHRTHHCDHLISHGRNHTLLVNYIVSIVSIFLQADPPNPDKIPEADLVGVTVVLLTCSYRSAGNPLDIWDNISSHFSHFQNSSVLVTM